MAQSNVRKKKKKNVPKDVKLTLVKKVSVIGVLMDINKKLLTLQQTLLNAPKMTQKLIVDQAVLKAHATMKHKFKNLFVGIVLKVIKLVKLKQENGTHSFVKK
jgi:hypothetical protein